jgi:hypothetical protein
MGLHSFNKLWACGLLQSFGDLLVQSLVRERFRSLDVWTLDLDSVEGHREVSEAVHLVGKFQKVVGSAGLINVVFSDNDHLDGTESLKLVEDGMGVRFRRS